MASTRKESVTRRSTIEESSCVGPVIREYIETDGPSWLRCRALSFLGTAYFDDVVTSRSAIPGPGFGLVAVVPDGTVIGIMDVSVDGELATIDTVAVHPDHQHRGIGRDLLGQVQRRLRELGVSMLDAWTRDDADALRWYRAMGFVESDPYLHVYASHRADPGEPDRAIGQQRPGLRPITLFLHASLRDERELREQFTRVHVCSRFTRQL